jgi:predicted metal-dependent HD superfamily phosphohydrolase
MNNLVGALGSAIRAEPLVTETVARLNATLDPTLYYHSGAHTSDVLTQALALAREDSLDDRDLLLLAVAAAFHDAGFLKQRPKNEPIGALMAVEAMADSGRFSQSEQKQVEQMILDTQLIMEGPAQIANSRLSPWLLDADLANLGRADFWQQTELLAKELSMDMGSMMPMTRALMQRHDWQSPAGKRLFTAKKASNLVALEIELGKDNR